MGKPPASLVNIAIIQGAADYFTELSEQLDRPYSSEGRRIESLVARIKQLQRDGHWEDALGFLLAEIDLQEADSKIKNWVVAPWYYEQAAIVYRKLRRYDAEVAVLERYFCQHIQLFSPRTKAMVSRLVKAKSLREMAFGKK